MTKSLFRDFTTITDYYENSDNFLKLVEDFGIRQIPRIPEHIIKDNELVKKLIALDPYTIFYLPEQYHNSNYFSLVTKNHEILLLSPINSKLDAGMINWIIDNCPDYTRFSFFQKPIEQLKNKNSILMEKIAIGFVTQQSKVPKYLENYSIKYKGMDEDQLLSAQQSIKYYEAIADNLSDNNKVSKKIKI